MAKEIKFSFVYRDMWQSSGKYQPRAEQLEKIAPIIVGMGCFDRVETNGGAFEQVQLMYGENPNKAVRTWTKEFNKAGIQTHMLERALNGLRMYGVPADVRQLMPKVKKAQGVDIMRSFDGLNDPRNLQLSVEAAKEAGMVSQAAISITHSPVHTVDYYVKLVDELVGFGADEIALKDMAGIGRPTTLGILVKEIKKRHPDIVVQYHGHTGPGFAMASMLQVVEAGADVLDVAMEPLSWGMVHPDVIAVQAMLKDAGYLVKDIDMDAYMEARSLTQRFMDDFLGLYIDPTNRICNSLLIGCGLPGGMMGSMVTDLKAMHGAVNMALKKGGQPEVDFDHLLVQLFQEVAYIWPMLGYPPLVTPFSQYTKNVALMNILGKAQGKPRFHNIDKDSWNMILGKSGQLPGQLAPEIVALAKANGLEFYDGVPQEAYPDALPQYVKEMEANGWDRGQDDEELFELAMHDRQYRDYKSGIAKERFQKELEMLRAGKRQDAQGAGVKEATAKAVEEGGPNYLIAQRPNSKPIVAVATGQLLWELDFVDRSVPPAPGKRFKKDETVCHIQASYALMPVVALEDMKIVDTCFRQGAMVKKGEVIGWME
ncbi:MAG: oxaloacetate decarboxylase [Bacteroidales bacterium]|nr:oxaloacetate decarboxylase [Bacteroidales bacterium]